MHFVWQRKVTLPGMLLFYGKFLVVLCIILVYYVSFIKIFYRSILFINETCLMGSKILLFAAYVVLPFFVYIDIDISCLIELFEIF